MQPGSRKSLTLYGYILAASIILTVCGMILLCASNKIYEFVITHNIALAPGSISYYLWVKNPVPIDLNFFLFNWTNSEKISDFPTIKPRFEVLGPYTYSETREKADIVWNEHNHTVTYKNRKIWHFDQQRTNGSLSDMVTNINPVALSAAYVVRDYNRAVRVSISVALRSTNSQLTTTHNVSQIIFEGYEERLLQVAQAMSFLFKDTTSPNMAKFGWFFGRNGSKEFDGIFNVGTGISNEIGRLYQYKYADRTSNFNDHCGRFDDSSAGDFFTSKLTKGSVLKFFTSDVCRYLELEFEEEVIVQGIVGYKYAAFDRALDNGTKLPENKCFCVGSCMPYGVLNVSTCRHGAPVFLSLPHFYKADPYYIDALDGLQHIKEKHDIYMIFEPVTGVPLEVSAGLQLNLQLQPIDGVSLFQNVPEVYMPIMYCDQSVHIPGGVAFLLRVIINIDTICLVLASFLISIGLLTCMVVSIKIFTTNATAIDESQDIEIPEEVPLYR